MTEGPPSTGRVIAILAKVAIRRYCNRMLGMLTRKRRAGRTRTPTARKSGGFGAMMAVFGVVFVFQSLLLSSRLVQVLATTADQIGQTATMRVSAGEYELIRWISGHLPRSADDPSKVSAEQLERLERDLTVMSGGALDNGERSGLSAAEDERIDDILANFEAKGAGGFFAPPDHAFALLAGPEQWSSKSAEPRMKRLLAAVFTLLVLTVLFTNLGMQNQDLGKLEWSFEWLWTFPIPADSLLLAKVLEYTLLNAWSWFTIFPLSITVFSATGSSLVSAIGLAFVIVLFLNVVIASLRLVIETWLRTSFPLSRLKNVQALCTMLGLACLYSVLWIAVAQQPPVWLESVASSLPAAITWLPTAAAVHLVGGSRGVTVVMVALVVAGVVIAAAGARFAALLVRGGLLRSSQVRQAARGRREIRERGLGGVVGKELRLLLRDRNFMVQTLVVPMLILGFQVAINPDWITAAAKQTTTAMLVAYGVAAYVLLFSTMTLLNGEGKSLWLLYSFPVPVEDVLRRKVRLWIGVAFAYALVVLLALGLRPDPYAIVQLLVLLAGLVIAAYIAGGLAVLGTNPVEEVVQRRVRPGLINLGMCLISLYAWAIYAPEWWTKVAMLVQMALLAFAIWQLVRDRIPYLLDPTAVPPPRITLSDGLVASIAFFVIQSIVTVIAMRVSGEDTVSRASTITVAFAISGAVVVICCVLVFTLKGLSFREPLGLVWRAESGTGPVAAVFLGGSLGLAAAALAAGYTLAAGEAEWFNELRSKAPDLGFDLARDRVPLFLLTVVAAPLIEEFLYRGLVFGGLRRTLPLFWSVVASAAIFAVVHTPAGWPAVFGLGVAAALAFEWSKTLLAPITAHMVYNASIVFLQPA